MPYIIDGVAHIFMSKKIDCKKVTHVIIIESTYEKVITS